MHFLMIKTKNAYVDCKARNIHYYKYWKAAKRFPGTLIWSSFEIILLYTSASQQEDNLIS